MDPGLILEFLDRHRGKIVGITLGLVFGWFAISYGLLKAVFVALCIIIGYYAGKAVDERVDVREKLSRLFRER
ncbi:MAG: DUF2273 domain-containing protein [Bacillota bacterium]